MTPEDLAKTGTEHSHQRALFAWANMAAAHGFAAARDPQCYAKGGRDYATKWYGVANAVVKLNDMFAIPNGGERNKIVAAKLKAEGVKPGVLDVMLPLSVGRWHGLFVEMKKVGGRPSDDQKDWIRRLTCNGYRCYVCIGWQEAAEAIQYYIEGHDSYVE